MIAVLGDYRMMWPGLDRFLLFLEEKNSKVLLCSDVGRDYYCLRFYSSTHISLMLPPDQKE